MADAFERKVLRRMFGGIHLNRNWSKRHKELINAAAWRLRHTFICQNKSADLDW